MKQALKILMLEDDRTDAELIQRLLSKVKMRYEFHLAMNKKNYLQALEDYFPEVILSDNSLPKFDATEALKITRQRFPHIPFILVTGTVSEEFAANIIKEGADDYILKDRMARLPAAIETALKKRKAEKEITDYRYALDQSAIVAITDQQGIIIYANENFCKISKYSVEELIGQDHRIINSGYHDPSFIRYLWVTIANGKIWRGEFRNKAKDGSFYWVDTTIIPFLNEEKKPYQYLSIRIDITEKKKAEENIQKSEEQYRDLVENITDLICTHDLDGKILSVNRAAEELIGHKFDPEENLNIKDILASDKKGEFDIYIARLQKKGHIKGLMKVRTFGGKIHIWEYHNSLKMIEGKTTIVRGYARDITESRTAEENLRKSETRLKRAQEIAHLGNWSINFETNTSQWSDEAYRIYGITPGDHNISMEEWMSFVHPGDLEYVRQIIEKSRRTLSNFSFQHRIVRKDGIMRHIYSESKYEFNNAGKPIGLYGITLDITEKKKLEEELLEQQRKEQLKITATALEAQEKERNAIGQEMHDNINQILVGTKMILARIKNKPEETGELVTSSITHLQMAIEENRRIAHELVAPDFEDTSLIDPITNLADSMLKTAGLDTYIDSSRLLESQLNDELKLTIYRIAQEQCTNIVKYAKATMVNITLSTADGFFKMIISDDGKGMEAGKKTDGIGLRNIKGRLSIFNGIANIITAPDKGFTLEISIPLKK
ncbi:MAG: PAS domain S-box protein [Bacteroidota bacterium]